jgi:hypothetical protein
MGVNQKGRWLYLVVIDGRERHVANPLGILLKT